MMTDAPAALFGLKDRGRIAAGWCADLVLFDPAPSMPARSTCSAICPAGPTVSFAEANGVRACS